MKGMDSNMGEENNTEISTEEKEKRFKILKIEKYNEQIDEEKCKITIYAIVLGAMATSIISCTVPLSLSRPLIFNEIMNALAVGVSVYSLKELISAIVKKTILTTKVEDLNAELDMLEDEESKGMTR